MIKTTKQEYAWLAKVRVRYKLTHCFWYYNPIDCWVELLFGV